MLQKQKQKLDIFKQNLRENWQRLSLFLVLIVIAIGASFSLLNFVQRNTAKAASPIVSSVSPSSGFVGGGTSVTITGENFQNTFNGYGCYDYGSGDYGNSITSCPIEVYFGNNQCQSVVYISSTQLTCVTPAVSQGGYVNVTVTNPNTLSGTLTDGFRYFELTLDSISPNTGSIYGGNQLTVDASGFGSTYGIKTTVDYTSGNDTNTKFLLQPSSSPATEFSDSSGNNKEIRLNGQVRHDTSTAQYGASSIKFDGSGDYIETPDSPDWDVGSGDFTIDVWVRTDTTSGAADIISQRDAVGPFLIYRSGASYLFYASTNNSSWDVANGQSLGTAQVGVWTHLAVSRQGNTFRLFKDGTQTATFNSSAVLKNDSSSLQIGRTSNNSNFFSGNLDNIRVTKGQALFTSNFSTSSLNYTPTANTKLLIQSDVSDTSSLTNVVDESNGADANGDKVLGDNHTLTYNGGVINTTSDAAISQTVGASNDSSLYFDGSGDYISAPFSEDFNFGSEDFTVDFWMNLDSTANYQGAINFGENNGWNIFFGGSYVYFYGDLGSLHTTANYTNTDEWGHFAFVRSGNSFKWYKNGAEIYSTTVTASINAPAGSDLRIGYSSTYGHLNGHLDNIRISKGIARWTQEFEPKRDNYGNTLTDEKIKLAVDTQKLITESKLESDCRDLRVVDSGQNELPYWIEDNTCNTAETKIWFEAANINPGENTFYITYGNSLLTDNQDPTLNPYNDSLTNTNTKLFVQSNTTNGSTTFADSSINNKSPQLVNQSIHSTDQKVFGTSSIFFDGSNDYIRWDDHPDWDFGSQDFTVDLWAYHTALSNYETPISFHDNSGWNFFMNDDTIYWYGDNGNDKTVYTENFLNKWVHYAVTRKDGTIRIFQNGHLLKEFPDNNQFMDGASFLYLGYGNNGYFNGYLDQVRVTKGEALWEGDFEAPLQNRNELKIGYEVEVGLSLAINNNLCSDIQIIVTDQFSCTTNRNDTAGTYDVVLTDIAGNSLTLNDAYTYEDTEITAVTNNEGSVGGGDNVNIAGSNFDNNYYLPVTTDYTSGNDTNTKFLLQPSSSPATEFSDSSGNNKEIRLNGQVRHDTSTAQYGASSIKFDGSGDYIETPDSPDWDVGSGDFTIDVWVRTDTTSGAADIISQRDAVGPFLIYRSGASYLFYASTNNSSWDVANGQSLGTAQVGVWTHLAVSRQGNTFRLFKDGTQTATFNSSAVLKNDSSSLQIGRTSNNSNFFSGNLDNIRVTKGQALFTSNFSTSSLNYTPTANTKLLIQSDVSDTSSLTNVVDESNGADANGDKVLGDNHTLTYNGGVINTTSDAAISQTVGASNDSSLYFDGSGDYISAPFSEDFNFGSEDFTVDFWMNLDSTANYQGAINFGENNGWNIFFGGSYVYFYGDLGSLHTTANYTNTDEWGHFAFVRSGNSFKWYKNGAEIYSTTVTASINAPAGSDLRIGYSSTYGHLNGHLDNIRISKGIARWTQEFEPKRDNYGNTLTDEKIKLAVDTQKLITESKLESDCRDLRVVDSGQNELPYWIEDNTCNTAETKIWFEAANINPGENTFYITYGNSLLTDNQDPTLNPYNDSLTNTNTKLFVQSNTTNGSTTFADSSINNKSPQLVNQSIHSTDQKVFGTSSIFFDGSNDYIRWDDHPDWDFGSQDFTVDLWAYHTALSNYETPISFHDNSGWNFFMNDDTIYWYGDNGNDKTVYTENFLNKWVHYAVTRKDGTIRIFQNGHLLKEFPDNNQFMDGASFLYLGYGNNGYFNGYLDQVRVTKGEALWEGDFEAPLKSRGDIEIKYGIESNPFDILFDQSKCENTSITNSTTINCTTPSHASGFVDVTLDRFLGLDKVVTNGFEYLGLDIATINPNQGPQGGGTTVTVTGQSFDQTYRQKSTVTYDDGNDSDTVLLLNSDTTDGSTTFTDDSDGGNGGSGHTLNANNQIQHSTSESRFGESSIYFDNADDYIQIPNSNDFNLSGDFTLDAWIYSTTGQGAIMSTHTASASNGWYWGLQSNKLMIYAAAFGTTYSTSQDVPLNQWVHVSTIRTGSTLKHFINGSEVFSTTVSTNTLDNANNSLWLGKVRNSDNTVHFNIQYNNGYMDGIRITKGQARWTSDFIPMNQPYGQDLNNYKTKLTIDTASLISSNKMQSDCRDLRVRDSDGYTPLDYFIEDGTCNTSETKVWIQPDTLADGANDFYIHYGNSNLVDAQSPEIYPYYESLNDSNTVLFIESSNSPGSTTFVDSSNSKTTHTITPTGNTQHTDSQKITGISSIDFDGSGDYLSIPDSEDFTFGRDDFTIETWIRPESSGSFEIFSSTNSGIGFYRLAWNNGKWVWTTQDFDNNTTNTEDFSANLNLNQWQHIVITRSGSQNYFFVNGILIKSFVDSNSLNPNGGIRLSKHWHPSVNQVWLNGQIDNFRIVNGENLYSNFFTPPATDEFYLSNSTSTEELFKLEFDSGNECSSYNFVSNSEFTCVTPAGSQVGFVDLIATNANTENDILLDGFLYSEELTLTSVNPNRGPVTGGQEITITGGGFGDSNLSEINTVTIGNSACNITSSTPTEIICTTTSNSPGVYDVSVTNHLSDNEILLDAYIYHEEVQTSNLQAYYDANNFYSYSGTGQTLKNIINNNFEGFLGDDSQTTSYNPTFNNSSTIKSFDFDGVDNFITTGVTSDFSNDFTIDTWFKRSANTAINTAVQELITIKSTNFGEDKLVLGLSSSPAEIVVKAGSAVYNSGFIANTEWQQATVTYDSANQELRLYVNGVLHTTVSSLILDSASGDNITIGGGGNNNFFEGSIASFKIYNSVLTSNDIISNFDAEKNIYNFNSTSISVNIPATFSLQNKEVMGQTQTSNVVIDNINLSDRRNASTNYTVSVSITDLILTTDNSVSIPASNIYFDPVAQEIVTGSGINNNLGSPGYFDGPGVPRNLINNTNYNGGGEFIFRPDLTVDIPPFSMSGNYEATLTITII